MDVAGLKQMPLFAALSKRDLQAAAHLADEIHVNEGTRLAEEGQFAHEFFAIKDGTADVIHDGNVIAQLGPGDFFGEIALLITRRRTASVVAKTPMKLVVIFGPNFKTLNAQMPNVKEKIDAAIEARCAGLEVAR